MEFTKTQLNSFIDLMLNKAFQSVMVGILSQNKDYVREMNDLYSSKKDSLYGVSLNYWESLKSLNKKYENNGSKLFSDFFAGGFDIMKDYFEMWKQSKIANSNEVVENLKNFSNSFIEANKENQNYCNESFILLRDTLEKINKVVEEFKKNAEMVIEKYSENSEKANA